MDTLNLTAAPRTPGKSAARALRREGRVPAVLYGHHQEPVHFSVGALDLRPLIHTSETHRVALKLDGETFDCILKDVTFHPVTEYPLHVDFQALRMDEKLTLTVPVTVTGQAPGIREGGELSQPLHELEIRCLPADIPGHVEVDVSALQIGDSIHVSDIELPNVEILTSAELPVVLVHTARVMALEEETATPTEGAEGEAAQGEGKTEEGKEG
ncbi:MAG TPA: 50S ribosomal protein L25 [Rubricoccaceae bacterium]|nr:50S ribosomal protein L25 [Rubricoccaceae bacterium]